APQRRPENVAKRRSGVGGAILGDRLLFLRHFERLDRDLDLVRAAVELGHPRVYLLSHRKTLRPLLAAVAGKLGSLDERSEIGTDNDHVDAAFLPRRHFAGYDSALPDVACAFGRERIAFDLLDAERDALFLHVDIEHLGFDLVAFLVFL